MKNLVRYIRTIAFSLFRAATLSILLVFTVLSCKRDDPPCKIDPDVHDSVEAEHMWMLRYKVGDTLRMDMYRINRDSGRRYEFIKEVEYVAVDIGIEKNMTKLADIPNCEHGIYGYPVYVTFNSDSALKVGIMPLGSTDKLQILFSGKDFRVAKEQYNYRGHRWHSELIIGDTKYYDVNTFPGFPEGAWGDWGYIDSTTVFYNYDYGILKFIINDTLAYIRKP